MPKTKLLAVIFIPLAVLASALTFLVLFLTDQDDMPPVATGNLASLIELNKKPEAPAMSDFMSPALELYNQSPRYYLFRQRLTPWDKLAVQQYWVSPKDVILKLLSQKNDKLMEDFLEKIP